MSFSEKLGYVFRDASLLERALTHRSFHNENPKKSIGHNERLEFLGDAVLDFSLSDHLMKTFPDSDEGDLSKIRASLVNENTLAEVARELSLDEAMRLGKGESLSGGAEKPRLLSSVLEAVIGAIYRDSDFQTVDDLIRRIFADRIAATDLEIHFKADYKTRLQEKLQELRRKPPVYELVGEDGPDHDKVFHVALNIDNETIARGSGKSKKQAEQNAAAQALEAL